MGDCPALDLFLLRLYTDEALTGDVSEIRSHWVIRKVPRPLRRG